MSRRARAADGRERCNGQGEVYWKWELDEDTNTWVVRHVLNLNRCMAGNGTCLRRRPEADLCSDAHAAQQRRPRLDHRVQRQGEPVAELPLLYLCWQETICWTDSEQWVPGSIRTALTPVKCLDRKDGNFVDGDVQMWDCVDGNTNQDWDMECVDEISFT